ncbi:MAG: right-handed parallel beta-helix repeat-containing protein [Bacteroidetes bacterium]|jgi:hypothetical protein|nr:right-handed parallel beta-helix repeat-containing protein [Bacteroidota bacterium]MBT6685903.1 right-handed parallel beta-helix repeat-containing protein [Bacteroidota bacterium]MBT7144033.1 right-handed parallel beta-helix repeat-containing protein [Bacteroidota bacterium]MBT7490955.1 right-handed parallel beta-helix repeat-containing protein [Bacteroidota bacterium]
MKDYQKLIFYIIFILVFSSYLSVSQTNYFISIDTKVIDATAGTYSNIKPGDTVFLEKGIREYLLIKNLKGKEDSQIVFINHQGLVDFDSESFYGISFRGCSHIKLTGSGTSTRKYGIRISRLEAENSVGIPIEDLSSDIEVEFVEISNCGFAGILAKSDPDWSLASVRDSFTLYNTVLHDLYIHDVGGEGIYCGYSKYEGVQLVNNGESMYVYPHLLKGVQIYNNRIERTGWDGIQVSSATENCNIFNNTIINDSRKENSTEMSGIILGGGSKCECYNNKILYGKGTGILVFGLGGTKVYNNLIVNPGSDYHPGDINQRQHGIYFSNKSTEKDSSYYFFNNTIINPKTDGIRINDTVSSGNRAYNNIIVNPGAFREYETGNTSTTSLDAYIRITKSSVDIDTARNFFTRNLEDVHFVNPFAENYNLQESSGLIDKGLDLSPYGIFNDNENNLRPQGMTFDIGAYESPYSNPEIFPEKVELFQVSLNQISQNFEVDYAINEDTHVNLYLKDSCGRKVETLQNNLFQNKGAYTIEFSIEKYGSETLFCVLMIYDEKIVQRIIPAK